MSNEITFQCASRFPMRNIFSIWKSMRVSRFFEKSFVFSLFIWMLALGVGMYLIWSYDSTAGKGGNLPADRPLTSQVPGDAKPPN